MHGLFGFDPKKMSDEELLERWHTLNKRIVWAGRFGSLEMVSQLQGIKASIEFEQRERVIEQRLRARASMPTVLVETDPDLSAEQKAQIEAENEKQTKKPTRPNLLSRQIRNEGSRERTRSSRPITDEGEDK